MDFAVLAFYSGFDDDPIQIDLIIPHNYSPYPIRCETKETELFAAGVGETGRHIWEIEQVPKPISLIQPAVQESRTISLIRRTPSTVLV